MPALFSLCAFVTLILVGCDSLFRPGQDTIRELYTNQHPGVQVTTIEYGKSFATNQDYLPAVGFSKGPSIPAGTTFYPVRLVISAPAEQTIFMWIYKDTFSDTWQIAPPPADYGEEEFHRK